MRIAVFGATGGTGTEVVRQGLAMGHKVTAVVRQPPTVGGFNRARVVVATFDEPNQLEDLLQGRDVVISALGTNAKGPVSVCTDGVRAVVAAMSRAGVGRLLAVSAYGAADTHDRSLYSLAIWAAKADKMRDKENMEALIASSDLDWTVVRPPALNNGPLTGAYRSGTHLKIRLTSKISRADLAHFLLREAEQRAFLGQFPRVAA
jgi:putative NADH-flavin reductase